MDDGGSLLGRYVLAKLDAMIDLVAGLDDSTANAVPDLPGANSAYQILEHCLGMADQWVHENLLGEPVGRDRDAEFRAAGPVGPLVARAREARDRLEADLRQVDPAAPPRLPRPGRSDFWGGSGEGVLLHVLEELCQHLGHLELTRDLVTARR